MSSPQSPWPERCLGELCAPDRGITYGIVKVGDYVSGGVPVIRGGDIRHNGIDFNDDKRVSEEVSGQFQRTILRGGEIVLNLIAEPGHCAVVPPSMQGFNVSPGCRSHSAGAGGQPPVRKVCPAITPNRVVADDKTPGQRHSEDQSRNPPGCSGATPANLGAGRHRRGAWSARRQHRGERTVPGAREWRYSRYSSVNSPLLLSLRLRRVSRYHPVGVLIALNLCSTFLRPGADLGAESPAIRTEFRASAQRVSSA